MDEIRGFVSDEMERAFLVAVQSRGSRPLLSLDDSLQELARLTTTAGMVVVGQATQMMNQIDPATFVGSGKLDEIVEQITETGANVMIFDDELSPRHQREIEKRLGENVKVIDRSALILDIFAQHAQTREGALQVELAQYEYRLPRLTRMWTHLARQGGGKGSSVGVGLRGPGETQLEVDKREIGRRIAKLKEQLEDVRAHRARHRVQRNRSGIPVIALVGYTNAGKSTLLNALTDSDVYVADQLFATLDPTTRRVELPSGRHVLFSDTVGFIQKLPTTLIAAFRATLEEITEADLLIHVVDSSHVNVNEQIESVEDTLAELDMPDVPRILVLNKTDALDELPPIDTDEDYFARVSLSARRKQGLDTLLTAVDRALALQMRLVKLLVPYDRGDLLSELYERTKVTAREDTSDGVRITAQIPLDVYDHFKTYER